MRQVKGAMRLKIKKWFGKKKLDEQLRIFFSVMISIVVVVMLGISVFSAIYSTYKRESEQAEAQLAFMASSYDTWMSSVQDLAASMEISHAVQNFCNYKQEEASQYQARRKELADFLDDYLYVNSDVNFISIINDTTENYVFRGKYSITTTGFDQVYKENWSDSRGAKEKGSLRLDCGSDYFHGDRYTVTFYHPVYSVSTLDEQIGVACINLNDSLLMSISGSGENELCMTDTDGNLIATTNSEHLGKQYKVLDFDGRTEGMVTSAGKCYFFKKISDWNYYVVSIIQLRELYLSSAGSAVLMILLAMILLHGGLSVMRRMIDRSYRPLKNVVDAMDQASENQLNHRINTEDMGEDFKKLGIGFNGMMDDIQELMEKVVDEQRQIDQIRLNALQSQIQPHFLYNTLDCIHWQARADGNREISDLVMALARYYRICLSKGKDIISLRQELEHIQSYLLIQNKRYGDIIDYEMCVEESFMNIKIPKLTLQPLVENSIYHGIKVKQGFSGVVRIEAEKVEEGIRVKVSDSGKGMDEKQILEMNQSIFIHDETFGYGVRNVNRRIELMFGEKYGLYYRTNGNGGVTVEILLPETYSDDTESIFGGRSHV